MSKSTHSNNTFFSFLDHFSFVEDDSSSYEIGITDEGFSYLDLSSEKKVKAISFAEKQKRETSAALDGSKRARGQSNISKIEMVEHDEVCFDTDLIAILKDIEKRKQNIAFMPWAIGLVSFLYFLWFLIPFFATFPVVLMIFTGLFLIPGSIFILVNVAKLDHSRRHVNFSYRIEGKGETAFNNINESISLLNQCGAVLLYKGRRHFEDSRYSGGAKTQPEFAGVTFSLSSPPLLDLDFKVWHMHAFQKDFYFMPDHILVFQGARAGGISYANLAFSTDSEILQERGLVSKTRDSNIVGQTWRFVNKDGSPDKRFNNNVKIPEMKYGILKLEGSGIDLSLYASNQITSDNVPVSFSSMQQLAQKPVRKIAEERRAQAIERRKKRAEQKFQTILNTLCCMMLADRNASVEERQKITDLMKRIKAPWDDSEIDQRMREFVIRARNSSYDQVLNETCEELQKITDPRQQDAIKKCLDKVANADGKIDKQEREVRNRFHSILKAEL
ncbi:Tellurite resistance protein TerB [Gimesia alba]|uniref:Tellurite resistance protein TerB n=1 Tax=Gimesia alba TaxID=2527973 RepID=A0A517RKZ3_9PLAN|nr:TerB family tellurite resistance protein [Gimesia alba]QDT44550.1 Tellurite resistance protein TerB [Gimesia alba]